MKKLTAEQLQENWDRLIGIINDTFTGSRKENLLKMYDHFKDRMMFAPASAKEHYHNAFPGGYVEHILHIIDFSQQIADVWEANGANVNYTREELIFAAMHHDLGKVGDEENDYYIPQTSDWHRNNRGELYTHNPQLSYMSVPDRALWLLQHFDVKVTPSEAIGIRLTDGLYDEANKKYLMTYNPDWELRSNIFHILHQADMMATKIEYDTWKYNTKEVSQPKPKTNWKKPSPKKVVANNAPVGKNMDLFKELFGNEAKEKN